MWKNRNSPFEQTPRKCGAKNKLWWNNRLTKQGIELWWHLFAQRTQDWNLILPQQLQNGKNWSSTPESRWFFANWGRIKFQKREMTSAAQSINEIAAGLAVNQTLQHVNFIFSDTDCKLWLKFEFFVALVQFSCYASSRINVEAIFHALEQNSTLKSWAFRVSWVYSAFCID